MGVDCHRHASTALPPGMIRYPLYRRLGGPQGRSGRVRKISPQAGFDHRTVHLAACCYTNYSIPVHHHVDSLIKLRRRNQGLILSRICIVDEQTSWVRRETALFILISVVMAEAEPKTYPYWDCMIIATSLRWPTFGMYPIQLQPPLLILILIIVHRDTTQSSLFIILQVHFSLATQLHKKIWPVPETLVTVLCTPDDGCGWHPKHVEWTCRIINRLLCVASRWTIIGIDQRCTEP